MSRPLQFLLLLILAPCMNARAVEAVADASHCATIAADAARLACYDQAFAQPHADQQRPRPLSATDVFARSSAQPTSRCDKGPPSSLLDSRWELDAATEESGKAAPFCIRPYRPIYLMPYYTSRTNRLPSSPSPENTVTEPEDITRGELKYELSLKTKILDDIFGNNGDFWMGYTQVSHWQIFNAERSRPFRETNYEPDANLVFRTDYDVLGWKARLLAIGLVHQSNGRSNPLSRSWNRATATIGLERENWTITLSRSSALPATHSLHCCCATRCAAASAVTVPCNSTGHSRSRRRCADMCRCSTAMARA